MEFIPFLEESPSPWQAVDNMRRHLLAKGFREFQESEKWDLKAGTKGFVVRNGSSLAAFILPTAEPKKILMTGSHTDSPGLKLKPHPERVTKGMVTLSVEMYGAPLLTSWLNRDLGIAGRVTYLDDKGNWAESSVVLDEIPLTIPQLAIHLDREVNTSGLVLNKQTHLHALAALKPLSEPFLLHLLKKKLPISQLLGHDLFLYPLEKPRESDEMITSYRIDNLVGVHAGLLAIASANSSKDTLKLAVFWDNEEIGSGTGHGASSPFAEHLLERLVGREQLLRLLPESLCISNDLAHAFHPNYPDKHDPEHAPLLGEGVVVKFNAGARYATDARSGGLLERLATQHKIPTQKFVVRSDIACGSTIGPLHTTATGMPTVDIGIPQLSMHSARELIAKKDQLAMVKLLQALFDS